MKYIVDHLVDIGEIVDHHSVDIVEEVVCFVDIGGIVDHHDTVLSFFS